MFDPLELSVKIEKIVARDSLRKYYRVGRGGQWYGGIATCDCVGCNLRCVFCWSKISIEHPEKVGKFYSAEQIFESLTKCAEKHGYSQLRVSGNEPTIGKDHLLKLLELIDKTKYSFILETNGILIGWDKRYAKQLSKFNCLHVRVSIKGTNEEEFSRLTFADSKGFELQLNSLKNLLDEGVSCHPAIMLSFSLKENFSALKERLREIDDSLVKNIEEEYVILYPHVAERLKLAGIVPLKAYKP